MKLTSLLFLLVYFLGASSFAEITEDILKQEISFLYQEIPELRTLKELSQKYGVTIYAFGGTAGSIADFALRRQESRSLTDKYLSDRLVPSFTNIIPPLKDIDIVIDGSYADLVAIQQEILTLFPRFMPDGQKTAWEFRLLRSHHGPKEKLLHNEDVIRQHSDSMSLTLLTISDKVDTLELKANSQGMLESLIKRELDYFFSDQHSLTSRYQKGMNPPILSVIRALTKMFEYELTLSDSDLQKMKRIVQDFDPLQLQGYPRYWVEHNASKLFQNSKDIHRSFQVLEEIGLRRKLTQLGSSQTEGSPSWWFSKEPLPKYAFAQHGRTAREIGITHVAHSTVEYSYFQLLNSSLSGKPNVFQSRGGANGERALHGNGFYAAIGKQGAWSNHPSAFDIVYRLHPKAREGHDFQLIRGPQGEAWILIKNENAIKRESTQINTSLADLVFGVLKIKSQSSLPVSNSLEEMKSLVAERFSKSSGVERDLIEDVLIQNAVSKWHLIPDFIKQAGGLSPLGQEKLANYLVEQASSGSIHENSLKKFTAFFTYNSLSKNTQDKIFETLFSNAGWSSNVLPALAGSSDHMKEKIIEHYRTHHLQDFLDSPKHVSTQKSFHLFLKLAYYLVFPFDILELFEEKLFTFVSIKEHSHEEEYWQNLIEDLISPLQKSQILEKRLSVLVQAQRWSLVNSLTKEVVNTKHHKLISFLAEEVTKVFKQHLSQKQGSVYLYEILKKLQAQNVQFDIQPLEYIEYMINLHLNPLDSIADQHFSLGHSIVNQDNLLTPYDHFYNWALQGSFDKQAAFNFFMKWKSQIDFSQNPGIGIARPFGRMISTMGTDEKNEYKNYLRGVVEASLQRKTWNRESRFEGDYSTIMDFAELLVDTPLFVDFPESLMWIHELALRKKNYLENGDIVRENEPSLSIVLDKILSYKGARGLSESLKYVSFDFSDGFDPLMQEILERTLYSSSVTYDFRVLQEVLKAWKKNGSHKYTPQFNLMLERALLSHDWQKHPEIKRLFHLGKINMLSLMKTYFPEKHVNFCKNLL